MIKKIDQIFEMIRKYKDKKVVSVAAAEDSEVLKAVHQAIELELCDFILFGNKDKILQITQENQLDLSKVEIRNTKNDYESVVGAIESVARGEANLPMKGRITTAEILSTYLKEEYGLKSGKTMNLVCIFEIQNYPKLIILSDAGMVISPTLEQKIDTIKNAVAVAHILENKEPKVAILGALEQVNPKMPVTMEAAVLTQMNRRGQIKGCSIDGPFALDNAISKKAAEHKGLVSSVAGDADILIVPDIEAGNILYKALVYFSGAKLACSVVGGKKPVILTSRADSSETKLNSIALSILLS
ncbi:MAG: bifunctional enoyl-CoA hydratase/phosphate acetyltransferase [Defluviitoga tunisiensis]|nr:bifunctional enoyl-CoA hydratase/phosphate acetyltransferase [Defluviitoga tunisiensis]